MSEAEAKPKSKLARAAKIGGAVLGVGAVGVFAWLSLRIFPIGTGIAAKTACSDVFVAGRAPEGLLEQEVPSAAAFVSYTIDESAGTATASAFGLASKTAVYRPGLGCALALDTEVAALKAEGFEPELGPRPDAPWPRGDAEDPRPDPEGLDRAALDAAFDTIFADGGWAEDEHRDERPLNTRAVVVVQHGRLLAERYAPGFDADTPQLGWSMTKSVTSALVGILVGRGRLDIDEPMGFAEWSSPDDPRSALTWDHLLRMSSGLEWNEDYGLRSDVTVMLFDVYDGTAEAVSRELAHDVDTVWYYSSGTTNLLHRRMREIFANDRAYHRFPYQALFEPLGMTSALMETDSSGTYVGSSFMYATPRDWARFGQLYLQDGVWEGERILPEGWVARTITPTSTPSDPPGGYGLQWWLNAAPNPEERGLPDVPVDAFWASGHQGQNVVVVPSRDAVIVRMGMTNGPGWPRSKFVAAVLEALPE